VPGDAVRRGCGGGRVRSDPVVGYGDGTGTRAVAAWWRRFFAPPEILAVCDAPSGCSATFRSARRAAPLPTARSVAVPRDEAAYEAIGHA
jgi:hypothetical protein